MKVHVGCCMALLVSGSVAIGASVTQGNPALEATGQKLGGYDLPYSGSGSIIYDIVDSTWTVAFEAPKGWPCTELGYVFKTEQRGIPLDQDEVRLLDVSSVLSFGVLDVHGTLELRQDGDFLLATVQTKDAVYSFRFLVRGELSVEDLELPLAGEKSRDGGEQQCAGGSCECTSGDKSCKACCPEGKSPYCNCGKPPRCICNKDNAAVFEYAELDIYTP